MHSSNELQFSKAEEGDVLFMTAVMVHAFEQDSLQFREKPMNRPPGYDTGEWLRNVMQQSVCYKITKEGKIIGGFIIFIDFPKAGQNYLGSIFIDPAYQNQGIGSHTLKFIEQKFPTKKWQTMTQEWAIRNHHFYEKRGYKKIREFYDDKGGHMTYVYEKTFSE